MAKPFGEQISKVAEVPFSDVHPSIKLRTTLKKGPDLPAYAGIDGRESKYRRCRQCSFIVNEERDQNGSGYGNEVAVLKSGSSVIYNNVNTNGGCPFCGSSEF